MLFPLPGILCFLPLLSGKFLPHLSFPVRIALFREEVLSLHGRTGASALQVPVGACPVVSLVLTGI